MLPPAESAALTATGSVFSGAGVLRGWSIYNAHATDTSVVQFYDSGRAGTLRLVATVACVALLGAERNPNGPGVYLEDGLYVVATAGTPTIVPYFNVADRLAHDVLRWDYASRFVYPDSLRAALALAGGS